MVTRTRPWHGIMVATTLPFRSFRNELSVDYEAYAAQVARLLAAGCDGVVPNGSLGEYQTLTDEERARVVRTAVEAAGDGDRVMPGVSAYGSAASRRWAEQAAEAGAGSVLLLPPNGYRADPAAVRAHFAEVAAAGLPVVAYNNPFDTKVDLTPGLLAELHADGSIVAVKEFSGDVRRVYELAEVAPELDLLIGADDVLLELALAGAVGWVAGYPNALPEACGTLYRSAVAGDLDTALPLYRALHPLLRWDSKPEFVQAIKLSMDLAGHHGGPTRPPRSPLTAEQSAALRSATEKLLADGHH
ncbi:dihydrodipicolinate synthase family protein [Streptomyces decoyicus]|uniref:dihydrodipicolinate synthase family protein n=1 Tax=Streptomyces decoyicus TaxID=249567 RepID=UPI00069F4108|nr:dihydrodipicolinate synthase family protein [Streptomyces decoyicus]KOG46841.1 dihydrodipicolinate synthase [Streptomyces decoyicus]QZY14366.1 dihydrodipicolinate synthase family protein [Streptomyces decoyicus]